MEQLARVFNYEGAVFRTVSIEGEPWFVAKDICKILEVGNPSQALSRLDNDEKNTITLNEGIRGNPNSTVVNESGLYSLILGSRKPEARAFKRWVTHDVLPSIRKTGAYQAPVATPSYSIEDPIARAKRWIVEEEQRQLLLSETTRQAAIIEEQAPKISYYDTILRSPDAVNITQIASDYGITPQTLNEFLRVHGVQRKTGGQWVLRASYANSGFTKSETFTVGEQGTRVYTKWTQKGRLFIHDLITEHGTPALIERKKGRRNPRKRTPPTQKPLSATLTLTFNR
ncbi:phage antirepressor [Cohnella mopanensis]|uniref:phage antirepressor n=1 Tax=Cohnella mopanensis TaxID=2911966 RepID=UPI001EF8C57D|nr:phage antirepressor KilAC domain-containing protein [Cohnella mopanensis]